MELPQGFIPLNQAQDHDNQTANFIGIVIDVRPPRQSGGSDLMMIITLQDESQTNTNGFPGFPFKFFRKNLKLLPQVAALGDIVVIRNIKITSWQGKYTGISFGESTKVLSFPATGIPVPEFRESIASSHTTLPHTSTPPGIIPTLPEQMYAIHLHHETSSIIPKLRSDPVAAPITAPVAGGKDQGHKSFVPRFDKSELIKDMVFSNYYDLRAEVVKFIPSFDAVDLYITDYTENRDLFLYEDPEESVETNNGSVREGDPYGYAPFQPKPHYWRGPFGQLTLPVRLWEPHAGWARQNIHEGDFVILRNVHAKLSRVNKLEGALYLDSRYPEKICIDKLTVGNQIEDIKKRKKEYEGRRQPNPVINEPKKASARKAEKKKKKQAEQAAKAQVLKELEQREQQMNASGANSNVRCEDPDVKLSSISDILVNRWRSNKTPGGIETELPFICAKYRSRVRVVDFKPDRLEDFARALDDRNYNDLNLDLQSSDDELDCSPRRWEWTFCLLVEDALTQPNGKERPERLRLVVANDSAQYLLKLDATDLQNDKRALNELRERLFILWGNLEELKSVGKLLPLPADDAKMLHNKPFDCCIEEYGYFDPKVHVVEGSSQRIHRIAGTTIMTD